MKFLLALIAVLMVLSCSVSNGKPSIENLCIGD